jgi:hypothetical protein
MSELSRNRIAAAGDVDDSKSKTKPLRSPLLTVWRIVRRAVRSVTAVAGTAVFLTLCILFLNYGVLSTPRARAYRDLDPAVPECRDGLATGWTILSEPRRITAGSNADGLRDPTNDEDAIADDPRWRTRLRCALQRHVIPSARGQPPLAYTLGFLEFKEDGEPYALVSRAGDTDVAIDSAMLRHAMEAESRVEDRPATRLRLVITQLDALTQHLATGKHYVIAFVHGWRHDARIGDANVADLRYYAAHAARFLRQRCPADPYACDADVTAIYVGWRGARVDEYGLRAVTRSAASSARCRRRRPCSTANP